MCFGTGRVLKSPIKAGCRRTRSAARALRFLALRLKAYFYCPRLPPRPPKRPSKVSSSRRYSHGMPARSSSTILFSSAGCRSTAPETPRLTFFCYQNHLWLKFFCMESGRRCHGHDVVRAAYVYCGNIKDDNCAVDVEGANVERVRAFLCLQSCLCILATSSFTHAFR